VSRLILASKSAIRAQLLSGAGLDFETEGSGVDEDVEKSRMLASRVGPKGIAQALSEAKALAVSRRRDGMVIGADQTLDLDGTLFDKAASMGEGRERLVSLRGRTHQLHSGVALARAGELVWSDTQSAALTMRAFSDDFLDGYVMRNASAMVSSVGGYQLEGEGLQLFERIDGDYFSILGLPMLALLAMLRREGVVAT
jgi:septum formation protein